MAQCPLRFGMQPPIADERKPFMACKEEECAWWVKVEKGFGNSGCAFRVIAEKMLRGL